MTIETQSPSGFTEDQLNAVTLMDREIDGLNAQEDALLESIRIQRQEIRGKQHSAFERRKAQLRTLFENSTVEDLSDPVKAQALYSFGWDRNGDHDGYQAFKERIFAGSYLKSVGANWEMDDEQTIIVEQLIVDFDLGPVDQDRLVRTAELIELIWPAQFEINPDAVVEFSCYYLGADFNLFLNRNSEGYWELHLYRVNEPLLTELSLIDLLNGAFLHIRKSEARSEMDYEGGY